MDTQVSKRVCRFSMVRMTHKGRCPGLFLTSHLPTALYFWYAEDAQDANGRRSCGALKLAKDVGFRVYVWFRNRGLELGV